MSMIKEIEGLVSNKIGEVKTFFALFQLETRLAAQSISPLLGNLFMIVMVVISLWLTIMATIGYCAFLIFDNTLYALLSMLVLNLGMLVWLFKYLQYNVHNMSFEKTRLYWKENANDLEKTTHCPNSKDQPDTTASPMPGDNP